ncbi:BTAD domain-containing putative transcriptional regulator [Actinoplanes sp. NBRC 103695]|uniref:AfsR/SARP family transcriptional regulator n=1 Tax=Actinoplanes sp. NBRC 103695 TaxID=3032202 RepID=UPI0024A4E2F7|nr:BTAD domain-containing putative transcriptional regulator [Actinoplanes sp. NBRC 103695]GLZ01143.1 regulatory protein AfsR [Actinoplanes sp. NBRC 103695]
MSDDKGVGFLLLGPVRVRRRDGALVDVGPPKQQAMLATLALVPDQAVSMARLVDALWGTELPATAAATVRTYAWRLRGLLARAGATQDVLVFEGDGYRLAVDPLAVDVSKAEHLAAEARSALAAEELHVARQSLADALALWAGEPLAGVPGPFAERSRNRLTELRAALTEQYAETALRLGHHQEAQLRLIEVVAEHPVRERPYVLLMRALYGMGRQVDALEVFHDARRLLVETHGVEPGAELTGTHERILRGDVSLLPAAPRPDGQVLPPGTPREHAGQWLPVPAQLPPDLPDFVGRAEQTAALEAVLTVADRTSPAVLAIIGMSGVGKTSLAVHLAHRVREHYPDGQLYVDLSEPDGSGRPMTGADLLGVLLAALGAPGEQIPDSPFQRRGLLRSLVDTRRLLVLLDDVATADQIRDVLPGTPRCAVLITSRSRLDELPLSAQLTLEPFDAEDALTLLRRRIGEQRVAAEPDDAVALLNACGGLPLAVRIVASRLASRPQRTLQSMAERLADGRHRIDQLRTGSLAVGAVFELGYRQLPRRQAQDFVLLAAVAGAEFGLPEAAAVLDLAPHDAELRMEGLVDAAMLAEQYPGRFRIHALLHSFALGREGDPDAERAALVRLLSLLLATARRAFVLAVPGDSARDVFGPDLPGVPGMHLADLRSAREWAALSGDIVVTACAKAGDLGSSDVVRLAVDLLIAVGPFADDLRRDRLASIAPALAEAALRMREPAPGTPGHQRILGRAYFVCSTIAMRRGRPDEVERYARRAVAASSTGDDPVILRQALNDLGLVAQLRHDYPLAVSCFGRAAALARDLGQRSGQVASEVNAALARLRGGDPDAALAGCVAALASAREIGDDAGVSYALYVLGLTGHARERYEAAVEHFTACAEVCLTAGIRQREAQARYRLADSLLALGRTGEALAQAGQAVRRCAELGAERDQANALLVLGRVLAADGRAADAVHPLTQARDLYASLGLPEEAEAARVADTVSAAARR